MTTLRLAVALAAGIVTGALSVSSAAAQTEADFIQAFSGDWQTFDPTFADGGMCQLSLSQERRDASYALSLENCGDDIASVTAWGIVNNQLALLDEAGEIRVRLGGNQTRMTGRTTDDRAVIFERSGVPVRAISARSIASGTCLYLGYTSNCAEADDLSVAVPADAETVPSMVMVDLNARTEARPDAAVVGVIPRNTCVQVSQCLEASDGQWCETTLDGQSAWMRQQVIRLGQWPAMTYRSGC